MKLKMICNEESITKCKNELCNNFIYIGSIENCGTFCSTKCRNKQSAIKGNISREITNFKKTGIHGITCTPQTKEVREKIENTNLKSYGTEIASQSQTVKDKMKATSQEKYGFDHPMKSQEVKDRLEASNMRTYGVKSTLGLDWVQDKIKDSNLKNNGVEYPMQSATILEKANQTNIDKYGFHRATMNPAIRLKTENTNIERFGTKTPLQCEAVKKKIEETNLKKYGFKNARQSPIIQNKILQTNLSRYGRKNPAQQHIPIEILNNLDNYEFLFNENLTKSAKQIANECKVSHSLILQRFSKFNIACSKKATSSFEDEICLLLENNNIEIKRNNFKIITPREIDIFLPNYNFAIECNGTYWHSEKHGKDKNYHISKTIECQNKGIELWHIWENEWEYNKSYISSVLLKKLNLLTNKIDKFDEIQIISNNERNRFLKEHSFLDTIEEFDFCFGLFNNKELYSILSIKKLDEGYYEIVNFCDRLNYHILGSFDLLFECFINQKNPKLVTITIDRGRNEIELPSYFSEFENADPTCFYTQNFQEFIDHNEYNDYLVKNNIIFDDNLSEFDNVLRNRFDRYWNCGYRILYWSSI